MTEESRGRKVQKYADTPMSLQTDWREKIIEITARTKNARAWITEHRCELIGKKVQSVIAHGKNIIGTIAGDYYFYSHQMMWGRWQMLEPKDTLIVDKLHRRAALTMMQITREFVSQKSVWLEGVSLTFEHCGYICVLSIAELSHLPQSGCGFAS
ncbi:hypothetical protein BH10CYA1_BH10CYA1_61230 [soil metagenome]